jgi:hypothetical protein
MNYKLIESRRLNENGLNGLENVFNNLIINKLC